MKLKTLIRELENWAPPAYQEAYDNSRLLTGHSEMEITGVLISLDCIESVVDEALANNCNVIVAHHPILFSGIKSLTGKNYVERTLIKAIKNDVAIYAIHTNLDNVISGVNHKIAEKIGLKNTKILAPATGKLMKLETACPEEAVEPIKQAVFEAGGGNIGNYADGWFGVQGTAGFKPKAGANPSIGSIDHYMSKPEMKLEFVFPSHLQQGILQALKKVHPYEEFDYKIIRLENTNQEVGAGLVGDLSMPENTDDFLRRIKAVFGCGVIKYAGKKPSKINKVALCGGAGFFLLHAALSAGADVYITADVKYHEFFDAENRILLADIGHYESEQFTKELIADKLSAALGDLTLLVSNTDTNPVNYL